MSWTDERVERLGRLWMDGRSASQIAAELGEGVSRNAVIGKIHRLGLAGRTLPPLAAEPERQKPKVASKAPPRPPALPEPEPEVEPAREIRPFVPAHSITAADVVIPFSNRVTIMDLRETMCRWPLGDPTSAEFRFCGCRSEGATPYCTAHARVAFQPIADRRRVDRVARIA